MESYKKTNILLLLSFVILLSCENIPSDTDNKADSSTLLNQNKQELSDAKISELFNTVFSEYENVKQVTLFSPDSLEKHIMYIDLGEETLVKNVSKDFAIEEMDISELQFYSQSNNCDNLPVGKIFNESDNLLHNLNYTVCSNYNSGLITFGYTHGANAIWKVEYLSNANVIFPQVAAFTHTWVTNGSDKTTWRSCRGSWCENFPNSYAIVHHDGDAVNKLSVRKLRLNKIPAPSTPVLTSPGNGDKIEIAWWPLKWNASSGNPSYEVNVNCGSSYNNTFSTNNTTFYLPSGISTGLTCTWKVRATNAAGSSNWSSQRTFETIPGALVSGTTTIPVNGAGSWSASVTGGTSPYTFEWQRKLTCKIGHSCSGTSWHTAAGSGNTVYFSWANEYQQIQYKARVKDGNGAWSEWSPVHQAFFN